MTHTFTPRGVCSRRMTVELEDGIIKDVRIEGGCSGNLQGISRLLVGMKATDAIKQMKGISRLVIGMKATDAIERMKGISCGGKPTSCPDQLSKALEEALKKAE